MDGIPENLLRAIYRVLLECDEFQDRRQLRAVFSDTALRPWLTTLQFSDSTQAQVDFVVSHLHNKFRSSGENALVLFLRALARRRDDVGDERMSQELTALAEQLSQGEQSPSVHHGLSLQADSPGPAKKSAQGPMVPTATSEFIHERARCVAHLSIQQYVNGKPRTENRLATGTGWLLTSSLLITNRHVIEARSHGSSPPDAKDLKDQVENLLVRFDFRRFAEGCTYRANLVEHMSEESDKELDYAILRLRNRPDAPLRDYGVMPIDWDAPLTTLSQIVIIQHPLGQAQQYASGRIDSEAAPRIFYDAPTENGTSGAPIIDGITWKAVGLHCGLGAHPGQKRGIRLNAVLRELKHKNGRLAEEILNAQRSNHSIEA